MVNLMHVDAEQLEPICGKKMLLRVDLNGMNSGLWCAQNAQAVDRLVSSTGALLIRGLKVSGSKSFGTLLAELFRSELLEYNYRSTPRTQLRGNVYTATEYHADATIVQHNECAYSSNWPMRLGFACLVAAAAGGETPICSSEQVLRALPPDLVDDFERRKLMYVRNYSEVDLPWSEVFQTTEKAEVDQFCRTNGIERKWLADGSLRTWQVNPAVVRHPVAGVPLWFNQAHLFHIAGLPAEERKHLSDVFANGNYPRNVYFGDGSPIPDQMIEVINEIYRKHQIVFPWQEHDVLLLDNMMYTHGRRPYQGMRKVIVGMARPFHASRDLVAA